MKGRKVQFWMGTSFMLVLLLISLFYIVYITYSDSNSKINQNMIAEQMRFQAESVFNTISSILGTRIVGFVYGDNSVINCDLKLYSGFDPSNDLVSYDQLLSTKYEARYPLSMNHSFDDLIYDVVSNGRYSRYTYPDYTYFVRDYQNDLFKVDNKEIESYSINLSFVGGISYVSLEPNRRGTMPLEIYGPNGYYRRYYIDGDLHYSLTIENEFGLIKSPLYIDIDGEDSQETTFNYSEVERNSSACEREECFPSGGIYYVWSRRSSVTLQSRFAGLGADNKCESETIEVGVEGGSDTITVTFFSGRDRDTILVSNNSFSYSRLGFGAKIVGRDGDTYYIELISPCNPDQLDSVRFDFGRGSRVIYPTGGIVYTVRDCCSVLDNLYDGIDMRLTVKLPFYGNIFKIPSDYDNTMVNLSYGDLTINRRFE